MIYTIITALLLHLNAGLLIQPQPDTADQNTSVNTVTDTVSAPQKSEVALVRVEGTISPPVTNYIKRGLERARQKDAQALII